MNRTKLSGKEDLIKLAYEQGSGLALIATTYGVSVGTVRNFLRKNNISMRPRGRRSKKELTNDQ